MMMMFRKDKGARGQVTSPIGPDFIHLHCQEKFGIIYPRIFEDEMGRVEKCSKVSGWGRKGDDDDVPKG
ncbi:hypothetical protein CDAR_189611 [Caerostris darwini]|uniref:Uncharacterized protein n=1 Tax=Caerostris darwini TaxID=1538125 RepID=A0AAV4QW62_9ARAC|nr:hypothetical protein CDAR_189611 [Caerostris darwini]